MRRRNRSRRTQRDPRASHTLGTVACIYCKGTAPPNEICDLIGWRILGFYGFYDFVEAIFVM